MPHSITEGDEGKPVVGAQGEQVGRVIDVEHGTAYVEPDPGLTDTLMSKLGWADRDEDTYPLQENAIGEITDDEIRLQKF
ncbi:MULTISPECIES: PRC-barrel domain containing protein [unclassified Haladaptatus]|uniref:PRC-barrel domain containing protein n=1 Tax=unclassified Haladaptatus TaxID=2622732 RepID=UPI0023E7D94F|nr:MULTISPECIES: PRC-barrel domain containing protein [unclassified Haladaptatus]